MKHNEWENDGFDELLRDALASDAAPSGDFTERLMEQVRRTPQEKAKTVPIRRSWRQWRPAPSSPQRSRW